MKPHHIICELGGIEHWIQFETTFEEVDIHSVVDIWLRKRRGWVYGYKVHATFRVKPKK